MAEKMNWVLSLRVDCLRKQAYNWIELWYKTGLKRKEHTWSHFDSGIRRGKPGYIEHGQLNLPFKAQHYALKSTSISHGV